MGHRLICQFLCFDLWYGDISFAEPGRPWGKPHSKQGLHTAGLLGRDVSKVPDKVSTGAGWLGIYLRIITVHSGFLCPEWSVSATGWALFFFFFCFSDRKAHVWSNSHHNQLDILWSGKNEWQNVLWRLRGLPHCIPALYVHRNSLWKGTEPLSCLLPFLWPAAFLQFLKQATAYIHEQNETVYGPRGLHITDPMERGLRVVSFSSSKQLASLLAWHFHDTAAHVCSRVAFKVTACTELLLFKYWSDGCSVFAILIVLRLLICTISKALLLK